MSSAASAAFQRDFGAAVLGDAGPGEVSPAVAALASQPGFAVYRNTVRRGCIDALAANHPVVRTLVGAEWFEAAAAVFVRASPPGDGRLALYGTGCAGGIAFADFLAGFGPAAELPYLADVAHWDRRRTESHLAADAPALDAAAIAGLDAAGLAASRLRPHPSARWAWNGAHPAFAIWRRHRERAPLDGQLDWQGDGGLVVRPRDAVVWCALGAGEVAFLDTCAAGAPFGDAAEALAAAPGHDVGASVAKLLAIGAFSGCERAVATP